MPSLNGIMHILDSSSGKSRPLTLANNVLAVDGSNATQPISVASLPLPTGAATATSNGAITSAVNSVTAALGGTLSTTASVSKGATTVDSASSVAPGDLSAAHDARQHRNLAIFGTTTDTSNNIDIHVSADGSTYYKLGQYSIFPASDNSFSLVLDCAFSYIKLKYNGTATVTAIISGSN